MSSEPRTAAGRRFYDVLARMGLAHAANGTAGSELVAIEAEAVAAYRADLEAKVRALYTYPDDMIDRAAVLRLLTDGAEPPKGTRDDS